MLDANPSLSLHVRKLDKYSDYLGPHARLLMGELRTAATSTPAAPASVIFLASAIMDVMLREPTGFPVNADGMDIAHVRNSRDALWLRERRNGIVHYGGGRDGLMGEGDATILEKAAIRAIDTLANALNTLT